MEVTEKIAAGVLAGAGTLQDAGRYVAEKFMHGAAKETAAGTVVVSSAKEAAAGMAVGSGAKVTAGSAIGGAAIAAAVSVVLSQLHYEEKKKGIRNLYREEIASLLAKPKRKVRDIDVNALEKSNEVVADQMRKNRKERTVNVGTIFMATMIAVGVVALAAVGGAGIFGAIAALGGEATIAGVSVGAALEVAVKATMAMILYPIAKHPIQAVANKIFKLNKETAEEQIESIHKAHKKGETITKEQVLEVFVTANPEIGAFIKERYGQEFDKLSVADKESLSDLIGSKLGVERIAEDINLNRAKATELAFTVKGKMSGVLPEAGDSPKKAALMTIKERLHDADSHKQNDEPDSKPKHSFVQRLEESRAAENALTTQR